LSALRAHAQHSDSNLACPLACPQPFLPPDWVSLPVCRPQLVERIAAPPGEEYAYWHVACARVVDSWHVTERSHSAASCEFGWELSYTMQLAASCGTRVLEPAVLQSRVLSAMGRGHPASAHSACVAEYARNIIARQTGASSSSGGSASSSRVD
jgi:hypothetical protein